MAIVAAMIHRVKSLCKLRFNPEGVGLGLAATLDKPIRNGSFVSGWLVVRDADNPAEVTRPPTNGGAAVWSSPYERPREMHRNRSESVVD